MTIETAPPMMFRPIETMYKGCRFRSRLEARWAVFFDTLGIKWEYEKEGYDLGDVGWFLPDFWLPDFKLWVEVKGVAPGDTDLRRLHALAEGSGHHAVLFTNIPSQPHEQYWHPCFDSFECKFTQSVPVKGDFRLISERDPHAAPWGVQLACPACRDDNVHFGVPVIKNSDDYGAWHGRGSALRIPMWCEAGHSWQVRYGFHKGQTFLAIEDMQETIDDPGLVLAQNDEQKLSRAFSAARSARFEHGERP